ncbi:GM26673 [Drosophila sechellia]|uniref:GD23800 n=2 Tax=melanogaster subgroup TaxID=32351 RepID=B4Q3B5_DROSI|nr:GM26673 [Drosophila sechellia]EDX04746.1 GD23800 [Drosophila simulans]
MAPKIGEISAPPANHSGPRYMSQCYVVTAARCAPVPRDVDVDVNVDEDEEMSPAETEQMSRRNGLLNVAICCVKTQPVAKKRSALRFL